MAQAVSKTDLRGIDDARRLQAEMEARAESVHSSTHENDLYGWTEKRIRYTREDGTFVGEIIFADVAGEQRPVTVKQGGMDGLASLWADTDSLQDRMQALIDQLDVSYRALAEMAGTSHSYWSDRVSGRRAPKALDVLALERLVQRRAS